MSTVIPLGPVLSAAPGRRRAGVAVIAGVGVGVTLIWGSLSALNRFVLGFHAWPQAPQVAAQRLVIPDAPARVSDRQRLAAIRLLGTAGGAVGGLRLVPGAGGLVVVSGGPASPGQGVGGITGSGPRFRPGTGGQSAPGVSGGVQSPSAGAVSKTDPDGDGIPTSVEQQLGTNPTSADSDGDGTSDGAEQSVGANPLNASDGGQPPVSGIGSPVAFGPAPSEGDSGAKDPSGGVGDPSPATGGTGAVTPVDPPADGGEKPDLETTPSDPAATPAPTPPATTPDPTPAPEPAPNVDPATAPEAPADPQPVEAPAPPEPETGGVAAPADAPVPVTAT